MRPIDADALIKKYGDWYVEEGTESGFIGTLKNLLATEPTIQPQSTAGQLNDGARSTDLIDRQAAIDAINHICPVDTEYDCTLLDRVDVRCVLLDLPSVQPEPAIPLSWINEQIERLKGMDNAFATLTAMQISVMVKKWRGEQHETD